jgi:hypothetical protein
MSDCDSSSASDDSMPPVEDIINETLSTAIHAASSPSQLRAEPSTNIQQRKGKGKGSSRKEVVKETGSSSHLYMKISN